MVETQGKPSSRLLRIAILPATHLLLCALTILFLGQEGWDWMFVGLLDLPVILLSVLFTNEYGSTTVVLFGTVQWLCIGIVWDRMSESSARKRKLTDAK